MGRRGVRPGCQALDLLLAVLTVTCYECFGLARPVFLASWAWSAGVESKKGVWQRTIWRVAGLGASMLARQSVLCTGLRAVRSVNTNVLTLARLVASLVAFVCSTQVSIIPFHGSRQLTRTSTSCHKVDHNEPLQYRMAYS